MLVPYVGIDLCLLITVVLLAAFIPDVDQPDAGDTELQEEG